MRSRRSLPALALACALAAGASSAATAAHATIVERVVAVVGERPILLSDLRLRARPFLTHIYATTQNPAQQAAQETDMFRELLTRMIDERLEDQAADKAHVNVTADEIDRALKQKADTINLTPKELLAEAKRQGLSEQDYRDELRRQILDGKLLQLRVMGRVRVTDADGRAAYERWRKDIGAETFVDVRVLAMRIPPGATDADVQAQQELAQKIVVQARGGTSFCQLVQQHTSNTQTKTTCGSQGLQPYSALLPAIQDSLRGLKEGETADPIRYGNEAFLVVQLAKGPGIPAYEEVKAEMTQRATGEAIERQRKLWLQELRRGVYVDVRL